MNVLIVDDQPSQRTMFRHLLEDISPEVKVTDFGDPVEALLWSQRSSPDLLLLDYRMPKLDGLEFARRFRRPLSHRDVPIILITVVGDEPIRNAALEAGVIDFLVKPVRPRELRSRCRNLLALRQQQQNLKTRAHELERQLLARMHELDDRERELLHRLAKATAMHDGGPVASFERLGRYAGLIAEALGQSEDEVRTIELGAPLRDIGKLAISDTILRKPGPLTDAEMAEVRRHPALGHELLSGSGSRFVQVGAAIALGHQERWDGSGYPRGLAGEDIPLPARIVAVADVLDAMTSPRPWRPAHPFAAAIDFIREGSGTLFDPAVVSATLARRERLEEVFRFVTPGQASA
ncbi:MAG: two-component system response regulator [Arenimonas sp. SCN 70-307]|uniref:HD domain-containing phosphohydrolase n=1 Tax=Arenimonas sp. SCN 70-307 TaxID=1660089 RepID=UPI00086CA440|nr:HD domain-containing phosphohydrolase [Arenimonas sp. SCN 70-307]ODS62238.1 MAG: two-component system response regulator [Arenimonas sp. SCN 70-307]